MLFVKNLKRLFRPFDRTFWQRLSALAPWVIIGIFSYWYVWLGFLNELHLRNGLDLGTYNQILYNLTSGQTWPPFNSIKGVIAWGDHAHFIMLLLAPLYFLWPSHMMLIVTQALAVTSAGWALYKVAQNTLRNYLFSYAVLLAYLLFFGIQYALDFDFHANVLTSAVLAWSFYALHFKKWRLFFITLILGLLTREDAAVFYVMLGLYLVIFRPLPLIWRRVNVVLVRGLRFNWHRVKTVGVLTIILSSAYFLVVGYIIQPRWQEAAVPLPYFDIPDQARSPWGIIWWIASNPITILQDMFDTQTKVQTITNLFKSFGFLPLLTPFTYLMSVPNLLARFLSGEEQRWFMRLHYSASLASVLAYGSILGAKNLVNIGHWAFRRDGVVKKSMISLIITCLMAGALGYGTYASSLRDIDLPLRKLLDERFTDTRFIPRHGVPALHLIRSIIPTDASVSASSGLVPALSARREIYNFPDEREELVDWIVLNHHFNTWPLPKGEVINEIRRLEKHEQYRKVWDEYGFVVFKQK